VIRRPGTVMVCVIESGWRKAVSKLGKFIDNDCDILLEVLLILKE